MPIAKAWEPPRSAEEVLRGLVVPAPLYVRSRAHRETKGGEAEIGLIPFLVRRGARALDIGANVGVWSYWLGKVAGRVEAFEPNPKIFKILSQSRLPRVTCHAVAASDAAGTAELRVPQGKRGYSNQGASLSAVKVDGAHGIVRVETKRIDDFGYDDVGFMKIDVEGFELHVVRGAAETIRRCRPTLVIEIEERHTKRPLPEQIAEVEAFGYRAFALVDGALTAFDRIDLEARHRRVARRQDYVFNFIFLPN